MATARQIAEAYFAAALDRGNLEDALRPYLVGFAGAFPDARYTINRVIESGASVALEGVYSATHTGTLRMPDGTELAATGRHVRVPFVTLFDVEGDKISSHRAYWDVATVMAQLGLMPSGQ
jgi:predicted ester cyclase